MSRLKMMAVLLAMPWLGSPVLAAAQHPQPWQEGEIVSRRTIPACHHNPRASYVYRIKGGGVQYTARFDQPLSVAPYAPLRFSIDRRHLFVQDADGSESRASLLKRSDRP